MLFEEKKNGKRESCHLTVSVYSKMMIFFFFLNELLYLPPSISQFLHRVVDSEYPLCGCRIDNEPREEKR